MNASSRLSKIAQEITDRVVDKIRPEKVIFFGSAAREEANESSDIDLFIVAKTDKPFPARMKPVHDILYEMRYPCAVESVIYTPEEFKQAQNKGSLFVYEVLTTGKVLYGS
jgi:predicted nucleotidyltransferase